MTHETILTDAVTAVNAAKRQCNDIARKLMAEVTPFSNKSHESILSADVDRVMSLAMDLVDARSQLAEAVKSLDGLKRRAQ